MNNKETEEAIEQLQADVAELQAVVFGTPDAPTAEGLKRAKKEKDN